MFVSRPTALAIGNERSVVGDAAGVMHHRTGFAMDSKTIYSSQKGKVIESVHRSSFLLTNSVKYEIDRAEQIQRSQEDSKGIKIMSNVVCKLNMPLMDQCRRSYRVNI